MREPHRRLVGAAASCREVESRGGTEGRGRQRPAGRLDGCSCWATHPQNYRPTVYIALLADGPLMHTISCLLCRTFLYERTGINCRMHNRSHPSATVCTEPGPSKLRCDMGGSVGSTACTPLTSSELTPWRALSLPLASVPSI